MKNRSLIALSAVALAVVSATARTVYTPAAATALSGANPSTDAAGGVWGFYKTSGEMSPRTALAGGYTRSSGLKGFSTGGGAPYIAANNTAAPMADRTATNNDSTTDPRAIQPGELLFNVLEDFNTGRAVLRFTPPRPGLYHVNACFRTVNYGKGDVGVRVQRRGTAPLFDATLKRMENEDKIHTASYVSDILLVEGDSLDFMVTDGGDGIACDATALKLEIIDDYDDAIETFDANAALASTASSAAPANPFTVPGGAWGWLATNWDLHEFPEQARPLSTGYTRAQSCCIGMGTPGVTPFICINTNTVSVEDSYRTISAGEMFFHPGGASNSLVRFTVAQAGRYRVLYSARDLSKCESLVEAYRNGVNVIVAASGSVFAEAFVSHEYGVPTRTGAVALPRLVAGEPIDLIIHNAALLPTDKFLDSWVNNSDATGVRVVVQRLPDGSSDGLDFGCAFAAEMKKGTPSNPFSFDGAEWEVGRADTKTGAFAKMSSIRDREPGLIRGWCTDANTTLPALCANISGGTVPGGNALQTGFHLQRREFWFHPGGDAGFYGVVRYSVPSTGVYAVRARVRDVNKNKSLDATEGVDCHLLVGASVLTSGYASGEHPDERGVEQRANLDSDDVYLSAGEKLELRIGHNGYFTADATAAEFAVLPGRATDEQFLNIDLQGASSGTAYAGRGRVGWASPTWNVVAAGAPSKGLWQDAGRRTNVRVEVRRPDDTAVSAVADAASNALIGDGVASTGPSDAYVFTVTGLEKNGAYRLFLYGNAGTNDVCFVVGGVTNRATVQWGRLGTNDVAVVSATADANGILAGEFFGAAEGVQALFGGLQIAGTSFPDYVPTGTLLLVR